MPTLIQRLGDRAGSGGDELADKALERGCDLGCR